MYFFFQRSDVAQRNSIRYLISFICLISLWIDDFGKKFFDMLKYKKKK